ncbi:MFS transporter [Chloroflexota bacterium]
MIQQIRKLSFSQEWMTVTACFLLSLSSGPFFAITVFFTSFEADFGWSRAMISLIYSLYLLIAGFSNIAIGWITDRFGPKLTITACGLLIGLGLVLCSQVQGIGQFLVFYAIASLGVGAIFVVPPATVQRASLRRPGLALGITTAGVSVGRMVFTSLSGLLLLALGWRTSYILTGVIIWALFLVAILLILPRYKKASVETGDISHQEATIDNEDRTVKGRTIEVIERGSFKKLIKTKAFVLTVFMFILPIACNQMLVLHIVPFAEGEGISKVAAAGAAALIGAFGIAGNIICPSLSGRISWRWLVFIALGGCSLTMVWLMATGSLWMLYSFVAFYGFFFYGSVPTRLGFVRHLFGDQFLASMIGILLGLSALFSTLAPLAAGYVYDKSESYNIAFLVAAVFFAAGAFIAIILKRPAVQITGSVDS